MRALIVILILCSLGLGVALMMRHNKAVQEHTVSVATIGDYSNQVEVTRSKLDEQETVNRTLQTNLDLTFHKLGTKSNEAVRLSVDLAKAQAEAKANAEAYQAAQAEAAKRQVKIDELTKDIDVKTEELTKLNTDIDKLGSLIKDTERKLAASEGDRDFLLKELKRLQTEKAELERQFNDLAALRSQVSKLREELSIAKRIDWIRMGLYGAQEQKGAEKLLLGVTPSAAPVRPGFDLNVELRQDGTTTVVPKTNAPPAAPAPPK